MRLPMSLLVLGVAAFALQGCGQGAPEGSQQGETTLGAAADDREQPGERDRRGCENLPSAEDLKRYLVVCPNTYRDGRRLGEEPPVMLPPATGS